jgi:hypothetical protein
MMRAFIQGELVGNKLLTEGCFVRQVFQLKATKSKPPYFDSFMPFCQSMLTVSGTRRLPLL